jgi:hypothetical protein
MRWWWPSPPQRSDDEISLRVAMMVNTGAIKPELALMYERVLRDEAAGKSSVMRDPGVRPHLPRRPSWARRWE